MVNSAPADESSPHDGGDVKESMGEMLIAEAQLKASKIFSLDENDTVVGRRTVVDTMLGDQYKNAGNKKFGQKQWEGAYEDYSNAIAANCKDATYYSNRSACLIQLDRPEEALEDAVFAQKLRPDWSKACYRIVVALLAIADQQRHIEENHNADGKENECDSGTTANVNSADDSLFETAAMVAWDGLMLDPKNNDLKVLLRRCAKSGRQAYRRRRRLQLR